MGCMIFFEFFCMGFAGLCFGCQALLRGRRLVRGDSCLFGMAAKSRLRVVLHAAGFFFCDGVGVVVVKKCMGCMIFSEFFVWALQVSVFDARHCCGVGVVVVK